MHTQTRWTGRLARVLAGCALALFALLLAAVTLGALTATASSTVAANRMNQQVTLAKDPLIAGMLLTGLTVLALCAVHALLLRFAGRRACAALLALWTAAAMAFVLAVGLVPRADSAIVIDAAQKFAAGDFSPMHSVYFHRVSYQLGVCLPLEGLARLLPGMDLHLVVQAVNCLLSAGSVLCLCALAGELTDDRRAGKAALVLCLAFVPALLFNMFAYGLLPMLCLCALAALCFVRYTKTRKKRFGLAYALLIGVSMVIKPNTMIAMLALMICAALYALEEREGFLLLCAALSAGLCVLLPRGVIALYELRSGVKLISDTGMLLRLAMGMQDSVIAAGWYNGVIEEYWDLAMTAEAEQAAAMQMLMQRAGEFAADPAAAWAFFREKCLTQWAEPSYDILWYGAACEKGGRFNGLAHLIFRDNSPVRALLEGYMNLFQQAAYALALLGAGCMIKTKRMGAAQLVLPVTILGGFLYHMLFEAKSQYIYPYMMLMLPLAASGLSTLSYALCRLFDRREAKKGFGDDVPERVSGRQP